MEKKNLIKSGVAVASLVVASMFGFSAAYGYGGSSATPTCSSVTYSDWSVCADGMQYRNIVSQSPFFCAMTASQQAARSKTCVASTATAVTPVATTTKEVLGTKVYANGTLLQGSGSKIYVVVGGKLKQIANATELAKYGNTPVVKVSDDVIKSYAKVAVLGAKKYGNGQLIRNNNPKIYVIVDGKKKHVLNLEELRKYHFGKQIFHVTAEELEQY